MRSTRQRAAVRRALHVAGGFRSAQKLHDALRSAGEKVGLTTVYRTLQSLAQTGDVDVLRRADGESIYRRCATGDHHHHVVCRACGHSVEVESDEIERWAEETAERHGFSRVTHTAEVYGVCSSCAPE
jgi:Fur family transcriptional regulator, ferric uptake regulator